MILLIDNYDSFSYNLYQLIGSFNSDIRVIRNDVMSVLEIEKLEPECIMKHLVEPLAQVLMSLGVKKGIVVYGQDKLDEISLSAPTTICDFENGRYIKYVITPEQFGFNRCKKEDLAGGTPEENAQITLDILNGAGGARRDVVLLNAGAALYAAGAADSIKAGIRRAEEIIDSKAAVDVLNRLKEVSNR